MSSNGGDSGHAGWIGTEGQKDSFFGRGNFHHENKASSGMTITNLYNG